MTSKIEAKRKELEEGKGFLANQRLEMFNLGIEMANKEFAEWLFHYQLTLIFDGLTKNNFNKIENKIKELQEASK